MIRRSPRAPRIIVWAALSLSAAPWGAQAQQAPAPPGQPLPDASRKPDAQMADMVNGMTVDQALEMVAMADIPPEIVVTGSRLRSRTSEIASNTVLTGEALATQARSTIGETLAHLPGASSTSFGPSASRPVLRGFAGERARLLIDGIGTLDASNTSPDHAVALNPLVADRIEVLRGPVSLLYASGSVGGVVNTVGGRIARRDPTGGIDAIAAAGFGSAANEASVGFRVDTRAANRVVVHLDGQYLNAGSVRTGGTILGPVAAAQARAVADPTISALADLRGVLPNTQFETWELAGGASLILPNGHIGFSFGNYESVYGLPTRFSLDPAAPVPDTRIDLDQQRVDLRFEINGTGLLQAVRGRFGWADYKHNEVIVGGPITATFLNLGYEARLEAVLGRPSSRWKSTIGAQFYGRDFRVTGAAPLLPPNTTEQIAFFTLHELNLKPLKLEGAFRYERVNIASAVDPILANPAIERRFDLFSLSGGASYALSANWTVAANAHYSQRAPVVEELFTQGVDPGTQGQLIGNPALGVESSYGIEAILRGKGRGWSGSATFYYTKFSNYIFARETGVIVDGLPVFQFLEEGANYLGFEVTGSLDVARIDDWTVQIDGLIDYTRATLSSGAPVPRIPPLRVLLGAQAGPSHLNGRAEVEYVFDQTRISAFETTTSGFAMVNLSMAWRPLGPESPFQFRLSANNLLDATGRRHASLLKDFAPLPGRDIRIGLRFSF
ncbi:MAG: TonB-dependent receptor [Sphingobium sp.]|nr:TonB-dependent receptor [Sphingobium sp.]